LRSDKTQEYRDATHRQEIEARDTQLRDANEDLTNARQQISKLNNEILEIESQCGKHTRGLQSKLDSATGELKDTKAQLRINEEAHEDAKTTYDEVREKIRRMHSAAVGYDQVRMTYEPHERDFHDEVDKLRDNVRLNEWRWKDEKLLSYSRAEKLENLSSKMKSMQGEYRKRKVAETQERDYRQVRLDSALEAFDDSERRNRSLQARLAKCEARHRTDHSPGATPVEPPAEHTEGARSIHDG
jgi:chromosome segregation ATPase